MKKSLEKIAIAAFAAVISSTQFSCTTIIKPTEAYIIQTIEKRDETIRKNLEDMSQSAHCLIYEVDYKLEGAPEGTPLDSQWFHSTAFAYAKKDGYSYLVTNNHVITQPNERMRIIKETEHTPIGPIPKEVILVFKKVKEKIKLVDNVKDGNPADDIELEVVVRDKENDIAILRTKENLYVSNKYILDPNFQPQVGDKFFLLGYPEGLGPLTTEGSIAKPDDEHQGKIYNAIDATNTFGNSGSPYFVKREDKLYWAGLQKAIWVRRNTRIPLFGLGIPIKDFAALLDKYK